MAYQMYNYGTANAGNYAGNTNYASSAARAAATSNPSSPNYSGGNSGATSIDTSGLTGYARTYAEARNSGASDVEAHAAATRAAGGSSFTAFNPGTDTGTTTYTLERPVIQPVTQPVVTQPVTTQQQAQVDVQQYLNELKEAQKQSRYAALDSAKANALTDLDTYKTNQKATLDTSKNNNLTAYNNALASSNTAYDAEQATIEPAYYDKRNQAAAASDVGAMNFAQYMAARGIRGAAGAMPEIYRNASLQGQIGSLDRAEAQDLTDLAGRRTATQTAYDNNVANLNTNYEADLAALLSDYDTRKLGIQSAYDSDYAQASADVDAASLQAYIDQMNADRLYTLQQQQLAQEKEIADMSYKEKETDAAKQAWLDTIGQFSNDYAAEINKVQGDNDTSNDWQIAYLQAARQKKLAEQEEAAAKAASSSTGSSSGSSNTSAYSGKTLQERQDQATGEALAGISQMAAAGNTYTQIYNWVMQNSGTLQANGVDMDRVSNYLSGIASSLNY